MNSEQIIKKALKVLKMIYLCIFPLLIALSGCAIRYNNLSDYDISVANRNYAQAAVRLQRCADFSSDSRQCLDILDGFKKSGLPIADAIKKDHEAKLAAAEKAIELARINALRESDDPWDQLSLALAIQAGTIEKAYPDEDEVLIEEAFFGFGECAKQTNSACMSQYAQMILYGMDALPEEDKESAREKALYWLNLSARYGNENARRLLISLEEDIPSPDLSMESLQKQANSLARNQIQAREEAERQQAYYNEQMLHETRRANFIASMKYFFPKVVNCTTTTIGTYTYTNCR